MTSTPGFEPDPNWWEASALDLTTPLASLVLTFLPLLPTNGGHLKDLCAGVCHFRNEKELSRDNFHEYLWTVTGVREKKKCLIADRRIPSNDPRSLHDGIPTRLCVCIGHFRNEKETGPS